MQNWFFLASACGSSITRPASRATSSGRKAERPSARTSALTYSNGPNVSRSKSGAEVDFPAPFGPATITSCGFASAMRLPGRSFPDAVQEVLRSDEDLAFRNGGRAEAIILQFILGQHFEFWPGRHDRRQAVLVGHVELAVGQHRRRAVDGGLDALRPPDFLSRLGVEAPQNAAVAHRIEVFPVGDGRSEER